jgi:hypothetical protein
MNNYWLFKKNSSEVSLIRREFFYVKQNRWNLKLDCFFTVPYVNAAATVLYQYSPLYGGPHVMYPSMAVLQPATTLLQTSGSQPNIPVTAACNQESKVGQQCFDVCVLC